MNEGGMTIVEYIGYNNPRKLNAILMQNGFSPSTQYDELIDKATQLISEEPDAASEILEIHPDREEIINDYLKKNPKTKKLGIQKELSSNCSGNCKCGGDISAGKFVDGNFIPQQKSNASGVSMNQNTVIVSILGIAAIFALYKILI